MIIRQGDVALFRVGDATPVAAAKITLANGEDSGHRHVINGAMIEGLLSIPEPTQLRIEPDEQAWRHVPLDIPPGNYRVVVQSEYTPQGMRAVGD